MKNWKIGIIGSGLIADFHAQAIQSLPNTQLAGIYNRNFENARKLANKFGTKCWEDQESMLKSDEVDIVMIATPSGAHAEPVIEAAKYGKHVLCEKPLEITLERIDRMIEAHKKSGTRLGGIFNYRYNDTTQVIKTAIDSGRLGRITHAAVYVPWWRTDEYYEGWHGTQDLDGGGALMNQSIHMIDLLQYLMGEVESLSAFTSRVGHPQIEVEDTATCALRFRNKSLGTIYGTTASWPGQFRRLEITGTGGTIVLVENSIEVWQFQDQNEEDEAILEKFKNIDGGGGVADPAAITYDTHAKNIADFIRAIEEKLPFEIDGAESRKAVEIVLNIYRSAREGIVI